MMGYYEWGDQPSVSGATELNINGKMRVRNVEQVIMFSSY
jgi:hypothetical protein